MRIVVAGSRTCEEAKLIERTLCGYIGSGDLVITGGCRGVDQIAHEWARRMFCKTSIIKADWDSYGKSAGPKRNSEMAQGADLVIVFWDGQSRGTRSMIEEARKLKVETHIYYV